MDYIIIGVVGVLCYLWGRNRGRLAERERQERERTDWYGI